MFISKGSDYNDKSGWRGGWDKELQEVLIIIILFTLGRVLI
jgi:hypothetical protein